MPVIQQGSWTEKCDLAGVPWLTWLSVPRRNHRRRPGSGQVDQHPVSTDRCGGPQWAGQWRSLLLLHPAQVRALTWCLGAPGCAAVGLCLSCMYAPCPLLRAQAVFHSLLLHAQAVFHLLAFQLECWSEWC